MTGEAGDGGDARGDATAEDAGAASGEARGGVRGSLRRTGARLERATAGCIAALPFAVALLPIVPGWAAVALVLGTGAAAVALVETDRLPVTYGAFFRWALATGVLGYAGWQLAALDVPPADAGVAFAYAVAGALVAVPVATYRRIWGVLVLD
ncbi:hypothetical protein [Halarchaeum nitratireducens]|uniref:Uncharacterized protein n=1 Tax=Halarchaeum nitratireducens TaxID=489913 RepID=A0A830G8G3_9EURY|nr:MULTISPECIES: hypothetical protein [Halarchaeum]MBP2250184.1 hypothetical protein [Halarchaeum solikamskense]GGN11767.1 hypothetical protein GCM10009021_09680 [Halarchaeum nitratireducens]